MVWPVYLCFITFGVLVGLARGEFRIVSFSLTVIFSICIGVIQNRMFSIVFKLINGKAAVKRGRLFVKESIADGQNVYDSFCNFGSDCRMFVLK